jgi:hypothetical protein
MLHCEQYRVKHSYTKRLLILLLLLATGPFMGRLWAWNSPAIVSPTYNQLVGTQVLLDWNAVVGSSGYQVEIDTSVGMQSPLRQIVSKTYLGSSSTGADTRHQLNNLYFGRAYYWRVRAWQGSDTSAWTETRPLRTIHIVPIASPSNGSLNLGTGTLSLDWYSHPGAWMYQVQVDTTNLFNSPSRINLNKMYIDSSSFNTDTRYELLNPLPNRVYFWRVRAMNAVDTSTWHLRWFSTGTSNIFVPQAPLPLLPEQGLTEQATTQTFVWRSSTYANAYQIYIDTVPQLNQPLIYTLADTSLTVSILEPNRTYYWYVRAFNTSTIVSSWSALRSFRTLTYIAQPVLLQPAPDEEPVDVHTVFSWNAVPFADRYLLRLGRNDSLEGALSISLTGTSWVCDTLTRKATYFWSVQAFRDSLFASVPADTQRFVMAALARPQLISPADNFDLQGDATTFSWTSVSEASGYDLQLSYGLDFIHAVRRETSDTEWMEDSLTWGADYTWMVRAVSDSGMSAWTPLRNVSVWNPLAIATSDTLRLLPYPNPSADYLKIPQAVEGTVVRLFGLDGRMVQHAWRWEQGVLDISALSKGAYWVMVQWPEGKSKVARIVKN